MIFNIGEWVYHEDYGVGQVIELTEVSCGTQSMPDYYIEYLVQFEKPQAQHWFKEDNYSLRRLHV